MKNQNSIQIYLSIRDVQDLKDGNNIDSILERIIKRGEKAFNRKVKKNKFKEIKS
jgi:hypothetical protein